MEKGSLNYFANNCANTDEVKKDDQLKSLPINARKFLQLIFDRKI